MKSSEGQPASSLRGLVMRSQSGHVWVRTERGLVHCRLRGRLKRGRAETDLAVIGDWALVRETAPGEGVIEAVEPRTRRFARRQPGSRGRYKEDILVANLDLLVVVLATRHPPPRPRLLDRFLVLAELEDVEAAIVLNKIDEDPSPEAEAIAATYPALGYRIWPTSSHDGEGVDALRAALAGQISAFVGPSGVGKSSLLNALEPGLGKAVGEVSSSLDRGRHTTRVAELHPLGDDAFVADTPGIRELGSFDAAGPHLARGFPEMRPLLGSCGFSDCSHVHEPRCAIRRAVDEGVITTARYESYLRMLSDDELD